MGNTKSASASQAAPAAITISSLQTLSDKDKQSNEILLTHVNRDLPHHIFERKLTPTSGRFSSTYRIRHQDSGAIMLLKCVVTDMDAKKLEQQEIELKMLLESLKECYHLASYQAWSMGSSSFAVQNQSNRIYRPVYLVRPHTYSTLSKRIVTRPFLCNAEKMFIMHQILNAVSFLHQKGLCHGHLTCDNIGLTSWNWVVILDLLPNGARPTYLEVTDSSDWIYYFQERGRSSVDDASSSDVNFGTGTRNDTSSAGSSGEKRCYIAPERFIRKEVSDKVMGGLTPAMDIFSLGCILMELFLNGEPAMDLGDLMEYKNTGDDIANHSSLPQKLNKIESSNIRACCKHMLHLDPEKRLSAAEYLKRLKSQIQSGKQQSMEDMDGDSAKKEAPFPSCHESTYFPLFLRVRCEVMSPDARIALAAVHYGKIIRETVNINDVTGEDFFRRIVGKTISGLHGNNDSYVLNRHDEGDEDSVYKNLKDASCNMECDDLLIKTELLLKKIEHEFGAMEHKIENEENILNDVVQQKSTLSAHDRSQNPSSEALVLFTQFVLSNILHAQRPSSKLAAMQILYRVSMYSTDDIRLQRIVPHLVTLLNDSEGSVRSMAVRTLTNVLAMIKEFPPSDAQIFPKYILKRMSHLVNDPIVAVRLAFAENMALLSETALRFLDTCHALKVYENGEGGFSDEESVPANSMPDEKLCGDDSKSYRHDQRSADDRSSNTRRGRNECDNVKHDSERYKASAMIKDEYDKDLAELRDIFARWIIFFTTDTSEYASSVKQAILAGITRLCQLFGSEGVVTCILPQILAFLNHRKDWRLRAALCQYLPSVCIMIGREATQKFVFPCVETALLDEEDIVVMNALNCLSSLVHSGLLTRPVLFGNHGSTRISTSGKNHVDPDGILRKYAFLLLHPSGNIRYSASVFLSVCSSKIGFPDDEALVAPILRPYVRHDIEHHSMTNAKSIFFALLPPFDSMPNGTDSEPTDLTMNLAKLQVDDSSKSVLIDRFKFFQEVRQRRKDERIVKSGFRNLVEVAIVADQKSFFTLLFPNQKYAELVAKPLPEWYDHLRQMKCTEFPNTSEKCVLISMSLLFKVYSMTIVQPLHSAQPQKMWKGDYMALDPGYENPVTEKQSKNANELKTLLSSAGSLTFNGSSRGEWGSISLIDPVSLEMSQLVSKLESIEAPVVPPQLGVLRDLEGRPYSCHTPSRTNQVLQDKKRTVDWKPRIDTMLCTTLPYEHKGPVTRLAVSQDFSFFVSASHDGTCKVFEMAQMRDSGGHFKSCLSIGGEGELSFRVNDLTIIENSKSVASGNSNGSVQVWRIEESASEPKNTSINNTSTISTTTRFSRVSGSKLLRNVDAHEGEILALSHFNTNSASIITFATQMAVHTWDLRCAKEPFTLQNKPEMGFVTSFTIGNDRNWLCTGSNSGHVALWDLRFHKCVKLWRHSSCAPINRLASSFASLTTNGDPSPHLVIGAGVNETSVFDLITGACSQCFRVLDPMLSYVDRASLPIEHVTLPQLNEVRPQFRSHYYNSHVLNLLQGARMPPPNPTIHSFTGRVCSSGYSYLVTGDSLGILRFWDFSSASKCFTISGLHNSSPRPFYECLEYGNSKMIFCREHGNLNTHQATSFNIQKGPTRPDNRHKDAILDIKKIEYPVKGLLTCSRDGSIKLWK